MRTLSRVRRALLPVALLVLLSGGSAEAQSDEARANARALATQGAEAFSEGRWQDAVDLFDRAEALIDAPTHLLYSARAHAKLHHYVKARELYLRIGRRQLANDAPRAFRDAQESAAQELKDVEPHVGQLTIVLRGPDPKSAKVTLDGEPVPGVLVGVARPIDPGEHQIHVEAPGFAAQSAKVTVGDGAAARAALELVPRPSEPGAQPEAPSGAAPAVRPVPPTSSGPVGAGTAPNAERPRASSGKRTAAYVAFGVGAVGLGAGAFFLASSSSKRSQADKKFEECGGATCRKDNPLSADVTSLDDSARSAKTIGIVGLAVGGVAVGTGVTLLVLGRSKEKAQQGLTITPRLGLGSAELTGTF